MSYGSAKLPIPTDGYLMSINTDPARDILINLIKASIEYNAGDVFDKFKVYCPTTESKNIVESAIPFDPKIWMSRATKFNFPLLAIFRSKTKVSDFSLQVSQKVTDWTIYYILPELDVRSHGIFHSLLNSIENIVMDTVYTGSCSTYNDGYNMLGSANDGAGFWRCDLIASQFGNWEVASADGTGIIYPTYIGTLQTTELYSADDLASLYPDMQVVDITQYLESDNHLKISEAIYPQPE